MGPLELQLVDSLVYGFTVSCTLRNWSLAATTANSHTVDYISWNTKFESMWLLLSFSGKTTSMKKGFDTIRKPVLLKFVQKVIYVIGFSSCTQENVTWIYLLDCCFQLNCISVIWWQLALCRNETRPSPLETCDHPHLPLYGASTHSSIIGVSSRGHPGFLTTLATKGMLTTLATRGRITLTMYHVGLKKFPRIKQKWCLQN